VNQHTPACCGEASSLTVLHPALADVWHCQTKNGRCRRTLTGDGCVPLSLRHSCLELQKVPSADGSVCMACDNSTGATLDTAAAECTCPGAGYALVERDATGIRLPNGKQCVQCPASSYRDPQVPRLRLRLHVWLPPDEASRGVLLTALAQPRP
jgi:hypothetical protein